MSSALGWVSSFEDWLAGNNDSLQLDRASVADLVRAFRDCLRGDENQRTTLRDLNAAHATVKREFERMRMDRADALNKAARFAETLAFYADPGTYFGVGFAFDPPTGGFDDDFEETELGLKPGKRAREALGK